MTQLTGIPGSYPVGYAKSDANSDVKLGQIAYAEDGRKFRWCKAGGSNLVAGTLVQAPAIVANHQNLATVTAAVGATAITVTLGNTAATLNQYAEGYLVVNAGTGVGKAYKIKSNPAAAGNATIVVTLEDPLEVATATADSKVSLIANKYSGVIINPTSPSSAPVGLATYVIAAGEYGWIQTAGVASALNDANTAVGLGLMPSTNTAGAMMTVAATGTECARALQAGVTTEYRAVDLCID